MSETEAIAYLAEQPLGSVVLAFDGARYCKVPPRTRSAAPWVRARSNIGAWQAEDGTVWAGRDIAWILGG